MSDSFRVPSAAERLTEIQTRLSRLYQTGEPGHEEFFRYYGAAYRYFLALVRDGDAARDLTNEFAQRFFNGDFRRFDPALGRFRDFLKVALRHMAVDHFRGRERQAGPLPSDDLPEEPPAAFDAAWQEELLHQSWRSLECRQRETGKPVYTVLRCKTENPQMRSAQLADEVGKLLGLTLTAQGVRQLVHRARAAFQETLLDEVVRSLGSPSPERLEQELHDLQLWSYCRDAFLERFKTMT
jgi:hypothetical protein